jgi:imidazolonepropionase-like amidohydrolase
MKRPADATVVSGEGQFLIPGLIDSHVHVTQRECDDVVR